MPGGKKSVFIQTKGIEHSLLAQMPHPYTSAGKELLPQMISLKMFPIFVAF